MYINFGTLFITLHESNNILKKLYNRHMKYKIRRIFIKNMYNAIQYGHNINTDIHFHFLFVNFHFIFVIIMSWLKANRVSAKQPINSSYNIPNKSIVIPKQKSITNNDFTTPDKIKSNPSFSLEKVNSKTIDNPKATLSGMLKPKDKVKLPILKKKNNNDINPQQHKIISYPKEIFYQTHIYRALDSIQNTYLMTLARQHFYQTVEALRLTKNIRLSKPKKQIKLQKISPHKKTVYLDLDQTLIHTDQRSSSFTVKLTFPIQTGGFIQAGVRIRPYCKQFLTELAKFAEIIIFTASSSSYADVILDHLDPQKKLFDHRLYRNHCTLQKGFYIKDLRCINRNLQDVVIVDNSAFSFLLQPQNGIPILPFYHFSKDSELLSLLQFLKQIVLSQDLRDPIRKIFFLDAYLKDIGDPKRIFQKRFKKQFLNKDSINQ